VREIDVGRQYEISLMSYVPVFSFHFNTISRIWDRNTLERWKRACVRHAEDLALMASYQDVKREGGLSTELCVVCLIASR
jgi:hypothetical protein